MESPRRKAERRTTIVPDPEALAKVGKAFDNAPVTIKVHFDLGDDYPSGNRRGALPHSGHADCRLGAGRRSDRRNSLRSGRKSRDVCVLGLSGDRALEDRIPIPQGRIAQPPESRRRSRQGAGRSRLCRSGDGPLRRTTCVRRFDSNRKDTFRYGLWAHALGSPKVDDSGVPLLDAGSYIPRNISGVADGGGSGGGDFMITLGAFGSDVGNESVQAQASTFMHELGHTLRLRHGAVLGANGIPMAGSELQAELSERHELSLPDWRADC